jgi:hypothetical protein
LQEPTPDERPITVDVGSRPIEIAAEIVHQLEERKANGTLSPGLAVTGEPSTGERQ